MTKNDILKALDELGFKVESLNERFYHFEFEGLNYLYSYDEDDDDFLHISIPSIFEVTDDNIDMVLPVISQANNIIKYAKIIYSQDMVFATFEYPLFDWVNLEDVIEFAVRVLQSAAITFNRILRGEYDNNDGEEVMQ
ncbi:MAG: hypothetical protein IJU90_02555 [Bacteroidales bacterium]|nr:hypothetical protein [Bacteroidales bacterium]